MAVSTFYAKSTTNSSYNNLLNGGGMSWSSSSSDRNLGIFTYDVDGIASTIPAIANIERTQIKYQCKQSRSNTTLYKTKVKTTVFSRK